MSKSFVLYLPDKQIRQLKRRRKGVTIQETMRAVIADWLEQNKPLAKALKPVVLNQERDEAQRSATIVEMN